MSMRGKVSEAILRLLRPSGNEEEEEEDSSERRT